MWINRIQIRYRALVKIRVKEPASVRAKLPAYIARTDVYAEQDRSIVRIRLTILYYIKLFPSAKIFPASGWFGNATDVGRREK